ncbi:hypothetical protein SETIT_9G032100v2 [Setaria italica]|uniref:Uncharacterized protein n=1 Tax=Setaria italica TaxID=4555 RepID=A0A368SCL3_SETIT|nr:hypothetical protein SETIT_9G032100v2 [Setaria italica]
MGERAHLDPVGAEEANGGGGPEPDGAGHQHRYGDPQPSRSVEKQSRQRSSHSLAKFASYTPPPADSSHHRYHNLPISIQDQALGAAELHPDGNRGSRSLHCHRPPELDPAVDLLPPATVCAIQQLNLCRRPLARGPGTALLSRSGSSATPLTNGAFGSLRRASLKSKHKDLSREMSA